MYVKQKIVLLIAFIGGVLLTGGLQAQITVYGTLTDHNKHPLAGVRVDVEGDSLRTHTDAEGKYSLTVRRWQLVHYWMQPSRCVPITDSGTRQRIDLAEPKIVSEGELAEGRCRVVYVLDGKKADARAFGKLEEEGRLHQHLVLQGAMLSALTSGQYGDARTVVLGFTEKGWKQYQRDKKRKKNVLR